MESSCQPNQQPEHSFLLDSSHEGAESLSRNDSFFLISQSLMESSHPPAGMAEFGSSVARPISLLDIDIKGRQFYLSQAAKKHLESLKGECYVISVSGNPLVGKSSVLNLVLSLFKKDALQKKVSYQDIYPVGDGKRRMTDGIDMFCLSREGKNFIFLDVEGDNDPTRKKTGVWIYSNLIQTAVGISHVHLHNYNGIPQESFCSYFETISPIVKQNNLHADFQTKHIFFRRNCPSSSKDISAEEFEEFKAPLDERLSQSGIDYSLHLLPTPPQHISEKKSETSCIASAGFLCKNCQAHEFITALLDFSHELNGDLSQMVPFKNGSHVAKIIEQLVEINQREIEFFLDGGHISKMRLERIRKEQIRIQEHLLKVEKCQIERSLTKKIQKILSDHPDLAHAKVGENFNETQSSLTTIISKMTYLIPELSQFIEKYLLDDRASILDEQEKKALHEAYVAQFEELSEKAINSLQDYDAIIESLCKTLVDIKVNIQKNLQEYLIAASGALWKSIAGVLEAGATGIAGFLGKEMITKTAVGLLLGGGVIGVGLTAYSAYSLIQAYDKLEEAKKEHEAALNKKKIDGINNVKEAEEELKKIEEFVTKLVSDLEKNRKILGKIRLEEEKGRSLNLVRNISKAMDAKINGKSLSDDSRARLLEGMRVAEKNLQQFKKCF